MPNVFGEVVNVVLVVDDVVDWMCVVVLCGMMLMVVWWSCEGVFVKLFRGVCVIFVLLSVVVLWFWLWWLRVVS